MGRELALAEVEAHLDRSGAAVLVGPGGIGKTRLADEIADRWRRFGRPAHRVDLRGATDVEQALVAIGSAFGVDRPTVRAVGRAIRRGGEVLVVLDNLEQIVGCDALLAGLAEDAVGARILGTSRLAMGSGVVRLGPLTLAESLELLGLVAPPETLPAATWDERVRLADALEGIPLAVVLAAARLEVIGVGVLADRTSLDRFAALRDPDRRTVHGALADTFAWSWELLSSEDREVLAALSAFVGPFASDAATAVHGGATAEALDRLTRASLVQRTDGGGLSLLVSIREFAEHRLVGEARASAWGRHAAHFAEVAGAARQVDADGDMVTALILIDRCSPELRAVLARAESGVVDPFQALECARGLDVLYMRRAPLRTHLDLSSRALRLWADPTDPVVRRAHAQLRVGRSVTLRRTGRAAEAEAELLDVLADPALPSDYAGYVWEHLADLYDGDRSVDATERALANARAHGTRKLFGTLHAKRGVQALRRGDRETSDRELAAAADAVLPGDLVTELEVWAQIAWARMHVDAIAEAEVALTRTLGLARALGNRRAASTALGNLGLVAEMRTDLAEAERRYRTAFEELVDDGDEVLSSWYSGFVGRVRLRRGDPEDARAWLAPAVARVTDPVALHEFRILDRLAEARLGRVSPESGAERPLLEALARGFSNRADRPAAAGWLEAARVAAPSLEADLLAHATVAEMLGALNRCVSGWRVDRDGRGFCPPRGAPVAISGDANRRIVAHLVGLRLDAPGSCASAGALLGAGWPGQRVAAAAGRNRVRVALSAVRRAGLAPLVQRTPSGWRLDPQTEIEVG